MINKVLTDEEFYNLEYPYKTLYIKETDVLRNFNKLKKFKPKYYIIASYTGNHYMLVTYKNKRLFNFGNLPFAIKELVMTKCMEGESGIYSLIPKFKKLKNFFYDYNSKYSSNGSLHILPAKIPNKIYDKVIKWAKLAHKVLGCSGISRSDFRYDDRNGTVYMLEINTQPGMTKTSLSPEQAKYCGISLTELVDKLISKAKFEKV